MNFNIKTWIVNSHHGDENPQLLLSPFHHVKGALILLCDLSNPAQHDSIIYGVFIFSCNVTLTTNIESPQTVEKFRIKNLFPIKSHFSK
jgi:hypothetical protein